MPLGEAPARTRPELRLLFWPHGGQIDLGFSLAVPASAMMEIGGPFKMRLLAENNSAEGLAWQRAWLWAEQAGAPAR